MRPTTLSVSSLLAALLIALAPGVADAQRRRSSGSKSSKVDRDAALEAALRKQTKKIQAKHCRNLEKAITWAARQGLKKEAAGLVAQIESILAPLICVWRSSAAGGHAEEHQAAGVHILALGMQCDDRNKLTRALVRNPVAVTVRTGTRDEIGGIIKSVAIALHRRHSVSADDKC